MFEVKILEQKITILSMNYMYIEAFVKKTNLTGKAV